MTLHTGQAELPWHLKGNWEPVFEEVTETELVVTGEGRVDATSFEGKVVGTVVELARAAGRELLVVGGVIDDDARVRLDDEGVGWIDLCDRFGTERALAETASCVAGSVSGWLSQ